MSVRGFQNATRKFGLQYEKFSERFLFVRYGVATLFVILALAITFIANPIVHYELPLAFFITSAIVAALLGGLGPGLYALVLGFLLGDYYFLPPTGSIFMYGKAEAVDIVATFIPGLMAVGAVALLRRAQRKLNQSNEHLEKEVASRTAELTASVKFLETFCYSISHNLRAPLRGIHGGAALLKMDCSDNLSQECRVATDMLMYSTVKMDQMINELLTYGRLYHQRILLRPTPLVPLIQEALDRLLPQIQSTGATIHFVEADHVYVIAQPELLKLAFGRILANSLKFSQKGVPPRVEIWIDILPERVQISVKDNGIGIEPAYHEKIFQLFEQLNPGANDHIGTGLAIARKAVERMNGTVTVDSALGKGSTFCLEMPRAMEKRFLSIIQRGNSQLATK